MSFHVSLGECSYHVGYGAGLEGSTFCGVVRAEKIVTLARTLSQTAARAYLAESFKGSPQWTFITPTIPEYP